MYENKKLTSHKESLITYREISVGWCWNIVSLLSHIEER